MNMPDLNTAQAVTVFNSNFLFDAPEGAETELPNARAKGRGRTKLAETGQSVTPRPLEL